MTFIEIPPAVGNHRLPVVAFAPVADKDDLSIAICNRGNGTFVTCQVGHGTIPAAENGHWDQTPERALYDFAERAGLLTLTPAIDLQLAPSVAAQVAELRAGCLNVMPVHHDWSEPQWFEEDDEERYQWWESFCHTDDNDQTWTLLVNNGAVRAVRVDKDDRAYARDEYDDFCEARGDEYSMDPSAVDDDSPLPADWLSATDFDALFDLTLGDTTSFPEGPMMNSWYPVESIDDESDAEHAALKIVDTSLCVVEVDGKYGLALTGGGQDMTWEICEAFVAIDQLPPVHFARDLPSLAGSGSSDRDRMIVAACLRSLAVARSRLVHDTELLTDRAKMWMRDAR